MKKFAVLGVFAFCAILFAEARITTIQNPYPGGLSRMLNPAERDTCSVLVVSGELNSADLKILRRMAGYMEQEGNRVGRLAYLDLSGARFKSDKNPYLYVDAELAHLCLYQETIYTNLQESFSKPSARGGFYGSNVVTQIPYVLGSSHGYRKNFALLNLDDRAEVEAADSYRMTSRKKKGIHFLSLRHIRGHHLKKVKGEWIWSSHIRKGQFCYDMFYGCPNLKVVILPESGKCCNRVWVYNDGIEYYTN